MVNLTFDREVVSCEAFGVYTGKKTDYDLKAEGHFFAFNKSGGFSGRREKDLAILHSYTDEPTVFMVLYRKLDS